MGRRSNMFTSCCMQHDGDLGTRCRALAKAGSSARETWHVASRRSRQNAPEGLALVPFRDSRRACRPAMGVGEQLGAAIMLRTQTDRDVHRRNRKSQVIAWHRKWFVDCECN